MEKIDGIKKAVKEGYAKIAKQGTSCCSSSSCCGGTNQAQGVSKAIGYSDIEMSAVPEGANLGLGCGNPVALASIKEGQTVLDLGSGGGFDCFLAARRVGLSGRVIGIDMTPEMIKLAKKNALQGNYKNVEFRLGEIENLPVKDHSVDMIISNCVINLSTNKAKVFAEAYRVLKSGGLLMISDLVLLKELPEGIRNSVEAYVGCLSGAMMKEDYLNCIKNAGFSEIRIVAESLYPLEAMVNDVTAKVVTKDSKIESSNLKEIEKSVASLKIKAVKLSSSQEGENEN